MYDVNKHFVIPWTRGTGNSIALLLNSESPQKAELMISHTWGEDADELIEALELFGEDSRLPPSTPVFFCTLSLYQAGDEADGALTLEEQIARAPFKKVIGGLPRHGMMVVHTTAQDVYTRMWCVHEVDEALEAKLTVRGAMSQKFRAKFIGPASEGLLDMRTERATCSCPDDEAMLRGAIGQKPGGFGRLDEVILAFRREMFAAEEAAMVLHAERQASMRSIRVVSGSRMLRCCASILRQPASAATYAASVPSEEVDYFVSHSQQTPWGAKAWALLYTATVVPAVVVAVLGDATVHLVTHALWRRDAAPSGWVRVWLDLDAPIDVSLNFFFACAVFVAMMPLAPHIPGMLRGRFFVDKCCISQDAESQLMMIRQLRSNLLSSKRMILLWQPEYFDSLACVHELATFLYAHKGSSRARRVTVVPVCMPLLTAALFLFHVVALAAVVFLSPHTIFSEQHIEWMETNVSASARYAYLVAVYIAISLCLHLVPSFLLWRFANVYMKQRRQLQEQLSTFRVEKSKCFLEAHRQALVADIAAQFGSVEDFERFIQSELPQVISVLRQAPVPLLTAMAGAIPTLFFLTSIISSALQQGESGIAVNAAMALPMKWLGTDSLALNLVLLLAGRMLAAEKPMSRACKRLLGPLASSMIFASLSAISVDVTILPIWGMLLIIVAIIAMAGVLYRQDYMPERSQEAAVP